jgi:hypothetical protein
LPDKLFYFVDFHVPKVGSKTRIVGFGPPPFPGK